MKNLKKIVAPFKLFIAWIIAIVLATATWLTMMPIARWATGGPINGNTWVPIVTVVIGIYFILAITFLFDFKDCYVRWITWRKWVKSQYK